MVPHCYKLYYKLLHYISLVQFVNMEVHDTSCLLIDNFILNMVTYRIVRDEDDTTMC